MKKVGDPIQSRIVGTVLRVTVLDADDRELCSADVESTVEERFQIILTIKDGQLSGWKWPQVRGRMVRVQYERSSGGTINEFFTRVIRVETMNRLAIGLPGEIEEFGQLVQFRQVLLHQYAKRVKAYDDLSLGFKILSIIIIVATLGFFLVKFIHTVLPL